MADEPQNRSSTWKRYAKTGGFIAFLIALPVLASVYPHLGFAVVLCYVPIGLLLHSKMVLGAWIGGGLGFLRVIDPDRYRGVPDDQIVPVAVAELLVPLAIGAVVGAWFDFADRHRPRRSMEPAFDLSFDTFACLLLITVCLLITGACQSPPNVRSAIPVVLLGWTFAICRFRIVAYGLMVVAFAVMVLPVVDHSPRAGVFLSMGMLIGTVAEFLLYKMGEEGSPPEDPMPQDRPQRDSQLPPP